MVPLSEYFRSVEWIWGIWLVSLVLVFWMTCRALKSLDLKQWFAVFKDEDGAAYSLSYVLVFPIYVLLVILVIETTLILIVKLGTIYAAYAAARSQIVWYSLLTDKNLVKDKSDQAAIQAMVPYASSWQAHARLAGIDGFPSIRGEQYFEVYRLYYNKGGNYRRYITNKYRWADWATKVTYQRTHLADPVEEPWNADIKATVKYRMPLHMPAIARILGKEFNGGRGKYYLIEVTSSATLQDEAAQNKSLSIGFPYEPQ